MPSKNHNHTKTRQEKRVARTKNRQKMAVHGRGIKKQPKRKQS